MVNLYPLEPRWRKRRRRRGDGERTQRTREPELRTCRAGDPDPPFDKGIIKA